MLGGSSGSGGGQDGGAIQQVLPLKQRLSKVLMKPIKDQYAVCWN